LFTTDGTKWAEKYTGLFVAKKHRNPVFTHSGQKQFHIQHLIKNVNSTAKQLFSFCNKIARAHVPKATELKILCACMSLARNVDQLKPIVEIYTYTESSNRITAYPAVVQTLRHFHNTH
jgi:hypothetical protein